MKALQIKNGFQLTNIGIVPENPTFEQWISLGDVLKGMKRSIQFWIGDWINYGEDRWGEKYSQALDETDYEHGTLQNFAWVSRNVRYSLRHENLSFTHHQYVAKLDESEQSRFLKLAEDNNWTSRELRHEITPVLGSCKMPNSSILHKVIESRLESILEGAKVSERGVTLFIPREYYED